jgi:hypothetical protein
LACGLHSVVVPMTSRLGLGADGAARYFTWGLTIGGWYPRWRKGE